MQSVTANLTRLYEAVAKVVLGNVADGVVRAQTVTIDTSQDELPSHHKVGLGQGLRWRFPVDSNTVFWWGPPPDAESVAVDEFLAKRGFGGPNGFRHVSLSADGFNYAHGLEATPNRFRAKGKIG